MRNPDLRIGRLRVRFRGVDARAARAAADGLGDAVLERLAATGVPDAARLAPRARVDAGVIRSVATISPAALRGSMADAIVAAIARGERG